MGGRGCCVAGNTPNGPVLPLFRLLPVGQFTLHLPAFRRAGGGLKSIKWNHGSRALN